MSIMKVKNFSKVLNQILEYDPKNTLVVFDIDNTLMRTTPIMYSSEWINYQEELMKKSSEEPNRATNNRDLFYDKYYKWMKECKPGTDVVDKDNINTINTLYEKNYKMIMLTARGENIKNITKKQLEKHYDLKKISWNNYSFHNGVGLFTEGIYFATGKNKGTCLKDIIDELSNKIKFTPSSIVFVDDSDKECNNVSEFLKDESSKSDKPIDYKILLYIPDSKFQNEFDKLDKSCIKDEWEKLFLDKKDNIRDKE